MTANATAEVSPDQETTESAPEPEKMVLIAASGDLDKAWPTLILATTGAAYGMDVTIFFTFWGLGILKRPDSGITGDICPAGSFCPLGSVAPIACTPGQYCGSTGLQAPTATPPRLGLPPTPTSWSSRSLSRTWKAA